MLEVIAKFDPFDPSAVTRAEVTHGMTVVDVIDYVAAKTRTPIGHFAYAAVLVGDVKVPFELWHLVRPKDREQIIINVLPGDDFGSLFVQLAGFALAAFVPPIGSLAIGTVNVGQFVVRAAITLSAMLISQAIAPGPTQISNQRDAPTPASYSISGTRNEAKPYSSVPVYFGRITNAHLPYAALPYTETWGGDAQYLRMLFCCEGEVQFSSMKVGDTPLSSLKNVSFETRQGASTDTPVTLFPRQVREDPVGIELKQINGYTYRSTALDTDEVSIEVVAPNGMGRVTDRNVKFGIEIKFRIIYFGPGFSGYVAAPLTQDVGGGVTLYGDGIFSIAGYSKATIRRSVRFLLPARGQYSVGIARVTIDDQSDNVGDNQSTTFETTVLSTIRSIQNTAPINRDGLAYVAIRAQASDQLNGVIDTFNCTVQRLLPVWNGSTWSAPQATRNPAWAFVAVLKTFARPLTDDRIDLAKILEWAQYCDSLGLTFDAEITSAVDVWRLLSDIASTGFASPTVVNDRYSVIIDKERDTPVQMFSARTVRNFSVTKLFTEFPHALKIRFPNEATLGQMDELLVYADGYTEANAVYIETFDLPFTRSAANAYRAARRFMLAARLRPRVMSFETDLEAIICQRGSLVRVAHPTPLIGTGAGRIRSRTLNGSGDLTHVTLDMPVVASTAYDYEIRVALSDGSQMLIPVLVVDGAQTELELESAIASGDPMPAVGDHVIFGVSSVSTREMIVRSVEWRGGFKAMLTVVDYSPEIFTSLTGPLPDFDPGITLPPVVQRRAPPPPIILSIDSDEDALVRLADGTILPRVLIAYEVRQTSEHLVATRVVVRWRLKDGAADPEYKIVPVFAGQVSVMPVEETKTYLIEMRTEAEFGSTSEWVTREHTVVGASAPPPDVETLYRAGSKITWPYDDPPIDLWGFYVRSHYGTSRVASTARLLTVVPIAANEFDISGFDGINTFIVTAVDVRGIESVNPAVLTINLGDALVANLVDTQSEQTSWSGAKVNGTVSGGELLADSTVEFWRADNAVFWADDSDLFWPTDIYAEMTYTASYAPSSDHVGATVKLDLDVTGIYEVHVRTYTSPTFWGSDSDPFWGSDSDDFWPAEIAGAWQPWPGILGPIESTSDRYEFRLTVAGGLVQGVATEMNLLIDVEDETESFEDLAIDAAGTRLTLTKAYRSIRKVRIDAVQDDGGNAVSCRVLDKDESLGPLLQTIDGSGVGTDGTVDVTVLGVKA